MRYRHAMIEARRELSSNRSWRLLSGFAVFLGLLALTAGGDDTLYWFFLLNAAPLGMLPLAAFATSRDRDSRMLDSLALSGVGRPAYLLGRCIFLLAFLVLAFLPVLATTAILLDGMGTAPLRANASRLAWTFLLGLTAAAAGIVIGVSSRRASRAVSFAFLTALAWLFLTQFAADLLALGTTQGARMVIEVLVHLSPITWALDDIGTSTHPLLVASGSPPAQLGAVLLATVFLVSAIATFVLAQHYDERARASRFGAALLILGVAWCATATAIAAWDFDTVGEVAARESQWKNGSGTLMVSAVVHSAPELRPTGAGDEVLVLHFRGPPGQEVVIDQISLRSPAGTFVGQPPAGPHIAKIGEDGPPRGTASLELPVAFEPHYEGGQVPFELTMLADGERAHLKGQMTYAGGPGASPAAPLAALASAAGTYAVGLVIVRRSRTW